MNLDYKKVLYINLDDLSHEFKIHEDLWEYVGGIGVGYKLLHDNFDLNPIVLSSGPLSGYFPYISKAHLGFFSKNNLIDKYGGGTIAGMMNMSGLDSIVFTGNLDRLIYISVFQKDVTINVVGENEFKKTDSDFVLLPDYAMSQGYFSFGDKVNLGDKFTGGISLNIDATDSIDFADINHYHELYSELIDQYKRLTVEPRSNPSCLGCPMGCDNSHLGEDDENAAILPRCLISCAYAQDLYKEIPNAYACLNSVGYNYHHSHLERLPELVGKVRTDIRNKIDNMEK